MVHVQGACHVASLGVALMVLAAGCGVVGAPAVSPASSADAGRNGGPKPGLGEEDHRILATVSVPDIAPYAFMNLQPDGGPVGLSPCRVWHVRVNPEGGPQLGYQVAAEAVAEVEKRTGIRLVVDGQSDETPSDTRAAYQPERYGQVWAPILIAWAAGSARDVAGHGGPVVLRRSDSDRVFYVGGQVTIDSEARANTDEEALRAVMLHELGHVVGLDHVDDPSQLMAATLGAQRNYAAGDRSGLAQLGAVECTDDV